MMTERLSDPWQTPAWLFEDVNREFNFYIDLCATNANSKCGIFGNNYLKNEYIYTNGSQHVYAYGALKHFTAELSQRPDEVTCFMNPPYSNPKPFIEKAWGDSKHCRIVCLVKCDTSTRWWATFWNYKKQYSCMRDVHPRGPKPGCEVRFFPKRIKFDPPQQLIDRGEVWKVGEKWVQRCGQCCGLPWVVDYCTECKGKGYKELSGPTFPSALIIMDRRG